MARKKTHTSETESKSKSDSNSESFEQALQKLEAIVRELEQGNLGLSDSLSKYEEGVRNLRRCHALLTRAEQRVQVLLRLDADGRPVTEDFDVSETFSAVEAKGSTRARKSESGKRPVAGEILNDSTDETVGGDVDDAGRLF
jgi:exodeoxyribonuclease VII small subunit